MTGWAELSCELDAWEQAGRTATWWWRDDDAVDRTPALETLLDVMPRGVALAVIPDGLARRLVDFLADRPGVAVLQHGFAHRNRAGEGERKSEFPDSREPGLVTADLTAGSNRLVPAFGDQFLPVLTPPWNRIGGRTAALLKPLGYVGLTRYLPRAAPEFHGVRQVNTHVDVIDWRGSRGFLGEAACLGLLTGHFRARRSGDVDPVEPTGLLTHHLVHDPATWRFLEKLRDFLGNQSAARLLDPAAVFVPGGKSE